MDKDVHRYQGHQYNLIMFDELTNWPTDYCYIYMFSCMRSAAGTPCFMRAAGNPGSIGHSWVEHRFIRGKEPYKIYDNDDPKLNIKMTRCFIPALLDDNAILMNNDPGYEQRLKLLPPHLYEAYRWGKWNIFAGQAFLLTPRHICEPQRIPDNAQIYMTFDWGYGKPFSVLWWWVDNDGRIFLFDEWYGFNGKPDEGIRLTDKEIAEGVIERERLHPRVNDTYIRLCDPTSFNKKPDSKGGGQGPSTAEVFSQYGLFLSPGDPSRKLKIRQFRERLRVSEDKDELPMMMVYETCKEFLRTVPMLLYSEKNPEDIDTRGEDHCYDAACHICMARPLEPSISPDKMSPMHRRLEEMERVDLEHLEAYYVARKLDESNNFYGMRDVPLDYVQHDGMWQMPSEFYYDI